MPTLDPLRSQLADVGELQVQADGYALRMVWQGAVNPVVVQTLEDYGGVEVALSENQALWFFFSTDALLAAARLAVWARFNPLALSLLVFPARFQAGVRGEKNLVMDEAIWQTDTPLPREFSVWAAKSLHDTLEIITGLGLEEDEKDNPDAALWARLSVDTRLPYQSPLSWFAILRAVGNVQDKNFLSGWRECFSQIEAVLQRNKLRFTVHEFTLMFPLDNLRQIKSWCRDFLHLVERLKKEAPEQYWPCVMAIVDRKGLSLNDDLPEKAGVAWEYLVPDYPHLSMRNALILGTEFSVYPVRFAPSRHSPDDWASLSLASEEEEAGRNALPQLAAAGLVMGAHQHCFYCGQRSHASAECPSRHISSAQPSIWPKVAKLDFETMRASVQSIEAKLDNAPDAAARAALISSELREESDASVMLKAFYDTVWPVQLRAVNFFWRARNKDLQKAAKTLAPTDGNPVWNVLEEFPLKEIEELETNIQPLTVKHSKDFRVMSLRGFLAMERGEAEKAEKFWRDAELASPHPIVQSWHSLLQARSLECRGRFTEAATMYDQVVRACPAWLDAEYRKAVCWIKSGFTEPALSSLVSLIGKSGHFFNKALIDPELERGFIQVMACLNGLWAAMDAKASEEEASLVHMRDELGTWFLPDNEFALQVAERIDKVLKLAAIRNYVPFQMLSAGRAQIERDIQTHVMIEAKNFKNKFRSFTERLRLIHEESAWFPFPRTLVEFNRSYNEGVTNLNWALTANFHTPEAFRQAQALAEKEEQRLKKLESRLRFLRIVRDSTLFVLSLMQTFFWLEAIGLVLIFVVLPLFLIYGDKLGFEYAVSVMARDRWQVQKALFFLVSVLAFSIAGLRTMFRFENIREKILAKAKESARKAPGKKTSGKKGT